MPKPATDEAVWIDINLVQPHPDNPRVGVVPAIKDAIRKNGWHGALVVQTSTGYILAGNHRWMAAQELGLRKVLAHYRDVDDTTARRILLADNRTSDVASYNDPKLDEILHLTLAEAPPDEPPEEALAGTGYTPKDAEQLRMALSGGEAMPWGERGEGAEESKERWAGSSVRQIVIIMTVEEYDRAIPAIHALIDAQGLETVSDAFFWLLEKHAPKVAAGA